jgi:Mn2+/Fe2+ NRAMP family transporter
MIPAAYGYGLFAMIYAVLFCIVLGAHGLWLSHQAGMIWRWRRPAVARLLVFLGLAVTPVISFYGSLIVQHVRKHPRSPLLQSRWSLIMPLIGAATIALCIVRIYHGYSPIGRTWSGVLSFAPSFAAFYLLVQSILYMAARVFGTSRHGPLATRVHLITSALVLGLA